MKAVFRHMVDNLGLIPLTLVLFGVIAAATAIALWIFFKLPTKEGGVYGGLESIKDPEEREAMRRYVFGLDEERPLIGKEKEKAAAKAAREAAKAAARGSVQELDDLEEDEFEDLEEDEGDEFDKDDAPAAEIMDADFETVSEDDEA